MSLGNRQGWTRLDNRQGLEPVVASLGDRQGLGPNKETGKQTELGPVQVPLGNRQGWDQTKRLANRQSWDQCKCHWGTDRAGPDWKTDRAGTSESVTGEQTGLGPNKETGKQTELGPVQVSLGNRQG